MREPRTTVLSRGLFGLTVIAVALGYGLAATSQAEDKRDRNRRAADPQQQARTSEEQPAPVVTVAPRPTVLSQVRAPEEDNSAASDADYGLFSGGRRIIQGQFIAPELAKTPDLPRVLPQAGPMTPEYASRFVEDPNFVPGPRRSAAGVCPTAAECMTAGCDAAGAVCGGVPYRIWDIEPGTLEPQADGVCDQIAAGGIGTTEGCPIFWMVSYQVQPGAETIASFVVAWSQAPMDGQEAHLGLYLDNSGASTPEEADPSDATLLISKTVLVPVGSGGTTDCLVNYPLDKEDWQILNPGDIFYVAATYVPVMPDTSDNFPTGADSACSGAGCPDDTGDGHFFPDRNWIGISLGMTDPPGPPGADCSNPGGGAEPGCVPEVNPQESTCGVIGLIEDVGVTPDQLSRNWILGAASVPAECGDGTCTIGVEDQCDPDNLGFYRCPADCTPMGIEPDATETSCTDNMDNDCNGDTDCDDSLCPLVASEVGLCGDGLDNDCDALETDGSGGTDCNDPDCYEIDAACTFTCDGGAIAEGETLCFDGALSDDVFNGGCNAAVPVWDVDPLALDTEYCGTSGNYFGLCAVDADCGTDEICNVGNGFCREPCDVDNPCDGGVGGGEGVCEGDGFCTGGVTPVRDTDWWRVNVSTNQKEITACVTAEFPAQFGFVDDNQGVCDAAAFLQAATATAYEESCTTTCLSGPGNYTVFVAVPFGWNPGVTEKYGCGLEYTLRIEESDCVAVDDVCEVDINGDLACQVPNQERNGPDPSQELSGIRSDTNLFENGNTQVAADTFEPIAGGDITEICWWGGYKNLAGVDADCAAAPSDNFTITYYASDNSQDVIPGSLLGGPFNVSSTRVVTNLLSGFQPAISEYSYTATHPPVAVSAGQCYWVEIQNATSATTCVWEWSTSGSAPYGDGASGDGVAAIAESSYSNGDSAPFDMAWCVGPDPLLISPSGCQISGGCCDQVAGTCVEDSAYGDCLGADSRFSQDGCAALSPECGSDECVPDACFYCPLNGDPGSAKSTQADIGGGNGACDPDGACDGNDRFAALNCFSNSNTTNDGPFPCEPSPPAAGNTDAGGPGISCGRDGVCDGNDAFHALACFSNSDSTGTPPYPCPCAGPAPSAPGGDSIVTTDIKTGISVRAPKNARPGELVNVDVYMDDAVQALRGYQLHLDVTGGVMGEFELVDISIAQRSDRALANAAGTWTAFNRSTGQLVVGMDDAEGVASDAGAYLATYTYRVPRGAAGTFAVEVQYDDSTFTPKARTFVFTSHGALVDVSHTAPALITVPDIRTRDRRLGMK